jgi:hypothetical protein
MTYCCPSSIKACAFRLTRELPFGVPVDPLVPKSRILSSAFVELSLSPNYVDSEQVVTRAVGGQVMVVDQDFGVLLGLAQRLHLAQLVRHGDPHRVRHALPLRVGVRHGLRHRVALRVHVAHQHRVRQHDA